MEIVKLPVGQSASAETDCIRIQELAGGGYDLTGSLLFNCGDVEPAESVSLIGSEPYESYEDAEAAGLAWANEHCVPVVHVSRSDGTAPLPDVT